MNGASRRPSPRLQRRGSGTGRRVLATMLVMLAAAPALAQGEPWALTPDERAYLDARSPVRYVHNPFSPPLSFTVNGSDVGIAPDLRHLMEVRLGVLFDLVVASNGTDMIARTLNGSVEVSATVAKSPEREAVLNFTQTYGLIETFAWGPPASLPLRDARFAGATVAVIGGGAQGPIARAAFPDAILMNVSSSVAGLEAVRDGTAVAMVGSLPVLAYESRRRADFAHMAPLGEPLQALELAFAVNSDDPRLLAIMEKGLASISPAERRAIFIKWTGYDLSPEVPAATGVPLAILARIVGTTLLAVTLVGVPVWILSLNRRVKMRTASLHESEAAQRALAAEVRALNEDLEARVQERTRELEAFSYSVSHDLRAPLRAIDGFSQALLHDYDDKLDEEGRDSLQRVRAASQRMGVLIDDMLTLSRITRAPLQRESVDVTAMCKDIVAGLRARDAGRDVEFRIVEDARASADPRLLQLVLQNLLDNAWKFTSKTPHARIEVGEAATKEGRAFFVRDNGVGFDPRHKGKLFTPFQRLHGRDEFEGNGVGLATVRRIVSRHGGQTWAEGDIGKGATFYFTIEGKEGP